MSGATNNAIDQITDGLERILSGLRALKALHVEPILSSHSIDPADPANKFEVGGLMKLTPQGEEICYRLFDEGKSRYAVCQAMQISFGAANHRFHAWQKAGGSERKKLELN